MRKTRLVLPCLIVGIVLGANVAGASVFENFQHGGRGMSEVGALTGRAPDAAALTYNPAAIAHLTGTQYEAGLDFNFAEDSYSSRTGTFESDHVIQFPPALYATWKPRESRFAFGIGLDSPFYYNEGWSKALFPGRFLLRRTELRLFELHPVLAWDLGGGWSLGGGVRYLYGNLDHDDNGRVSVFLPSSGPVTVEAQRNVSADVDAFAWDLAVHYADPAWGWGAVYRSSARLDGASDVRYAPRDVPPVAGLSGPLSTLLASGHARTSFELPQEFRSGIWVAPYPELRLEFDLDYQLWSDLDRTTVTFTPNPFDPQHPTLVTPRDWKDTASLRLGVEGDITDHLVFSGGLAFEPSPVPDNTVEPGFPRGDAWVYAAGFSYNFPRLSFDVGYSLHQFQSRGASGQELLNPGVNGRYSGREHVWGFGVRWRR
jgi:long-chain fatty acid transport protein